ncbi:hypothetical protein MSG28_012769 [Choristoneura fumiferana]|uniref:Uncharacterized protein n=1 Tax=Choristoneura fumiferana TaxID=7141 RepID=A0ACC0JHZ1_CHOFU|nr:hypothetical protein MSG28_012769 [Choristoneura fumiferana]
MVVNPSNAGAVSEFDTSVRQLYMSLGWGSLPLLPLGCVLEHLSLEDALAATSVSRHWRNSLLMYEGRRHTLKLYAKHYDKSFFLARIFKKHVQALHISVAECSQAELNNFMHRVMPQCTGLQVVGPCARSARIATTILLANPAVKQQCLHCCVSAWRVRQPVKLLALADVVEYVRRKSGYTLRMFQLQSRHYVHFSSFVVRVPRLLMGTIASPTFWPKDVVIITESLVFRHSHSIRKFAVMNCEMDTVHEKKKDKYIVMDLMQGPPGLLPLSCSHPAVKQQCLHFVFGVETRQRRILLTRLRFDSPSVADAVLSRHNAEAMMFSSLQHIIVDYDHITTETLETLSHLSAFSQLSVIVCNKKPALHSVDWRRVACGYPNGLDVAVNLISLPKKKIEEAIENVLVEDLPLTSLKVLFCNALHTHLIKHVVRCYKASLREFVCADAPHEGHMRTPIVNTEYDACHVNPFILLCWQCAQLKRLVIHGYWVWQYDIIGLVRLRASLRQLEISAVCGRRQPPPGPQLARVRAADAGDQVDTHFVKQVNEYTEFKWKPIPWRSLPGALRARASPAQLERYLTQELSRPPGVTSNHKSWHEWIE